MNGEEAGFAKGVLQLMWAPFLALVALVWRQQNGATNQRLDSCNASIKAQAEAQAQALLRHGLEDEKAFEAVHEELQTQRGHIAKLFDKLEEHSRRSEDRHLELLKSLHEGLRGK